MRKYLLIVTKKLAVLLAVLAFLVSQPVYAGFTQSTDLESGSSQYWSTSSQVSLSGQTATFACWINMESLTADIYAIIWKANGDGSTRNFMLYLLDNSGTQQLVGDVYNGANHTDSGGNLTNTSTSNWTYVWATFDGTQAANQKWNLYQDSTTALSKTSFTDNASTITDSNVPIAVGAQPNTSPIRFFDGKMSHCRVYSAVISASDMYNTERCLDHSAQASLVSEWKFDGNGNDSSGNGYNLTAQGSAGFVADGPPCVAATSQFPTFFSLWW